MVLVCGATGLLGGRVAERLAEAGASVRVLVRPDTDAAPLAARGLEIARGDLRERSSLGDAVADCETVVTTVTAMSRLLERKEKTTITATDRRGTLNLVDAAERAGVRRFVFVSYAGLHEGQRFPLARAKCAVEERLAASTLRPVVLRPDAFQEVWLSKAVGLDPDGGKLTVYGRGENPVAYVAVDDVAAATARLTLVDDPPGVLEFGGPERLTRNEIVELIRASRGDGLQVKRVPRAALRIGSAFLSPFKQELSSVMGLALHLDDTPARWDDRPLRALGVEPRPASRYLRESLGATG